MRVERFDNYQRFMGLTRWSLVYVPGGSRVEADVEMSVGEITVALVPVLLPFRMSGARAVVRAPGMTRVHLGIARGWFYRLLIIPRQFRYPGVDYQLKWRVVP